MVSKWTKYKFDFTTMSSSLMNLIDSYRWLIAKGRTETALDIIKTAADVNKVKLSPEIFSSGLENDKNVTIEPEEVPQYGVLDIFRK